MNNERAVQKANRHPGLRFHRPAGTDQACLPRMRIRAADDEPPVAAACPVAPLEVPDAHIQAFCPTAPPIGFG